MELMKNIPSGSIDLILTDPPYGTTNCRWDTVIPFEPMWEQLNRIIKPNGAICLFGSEPFSSSLRMSNIKNFKYDWYWQKTTPTGFLNAKKQPLRNIETISVFYQNSLHIIRKKHTDTKEKSALQNTNRIAKKLKSIMIMVWLLMIVRNDTLHKYCSSKQTDKNVHCTQRKNLLHCWNT